MTLSPGTDRLHNIEHLCFDFDGTLYDSLPGIGWSIEQAFVACGLPCATVNLRPLIGPPVRHILGHLAGPGTSEEMLDALEQAFRQHYDRYGSERISSYPQVLETLNTLRQQHALYVVTNKPGAITHRILEGDGLINWFCEILTKDSRHPAYQTKGEMLNDLLSRRNLAPSSVLMIGDTAEDRAAAVAANVQFAFMTYGYGHLETSNTFYRLDHFRQLATLVARENLE